MNGTATINALNTDFTIVIQEGGNYTAEYKGGEYPVDSPLILKSGPQKEPEIGEGGE